jgi:hypothetical protein
VVLGSEEFGDFGGGDAVGCAGETDGETVELGKKRDGVQVVLLVNASQIVSVVENGSATVGGWGVCARFSDLLGVLALKSESFALGDGSNEGAVQTTGEKNTVGNLSHQSLSH